MPEPGTTTVTAAKTTRRLLLVEDDETFRHLLAEQLEDCGYEVHHTARGEQGLQIISSETIDVALIDLRMPGMDGLRFMQRLREQEEEPPPVIVLTGHGSIESAIEVTRAGAFHFATKPCPFGELVSLIERAIESRDDRARVQGLLRQMDQVRPNGSMIGNSAPMRKLADDLKKIAAADASVLITGESGTGKELVARLLHERSPRRDEPFLAINCAALPDSLLESELFGYEKGAFTGAQSRKPGLLESASRGTILLDEIAEMPATTQAKLLRVLQFGTFTRVGGLRENRMSARILAATNRDLAARIREGSFREDLFYRLNTVELHVPALRERVEDLPDLAAAFLARAGRPEWARELDRETLELLRGHGWPGNVRELENLMERVMILAEEAGDLPVIIGDYIRSRRREGLEGESFLLEEVERRHIQRVLAMCDGNKTKAAALLGIAIKTLYNKLKSYE
ncbi:MAG: sigma-54-dependent Fis family transcriptional regulator [Planctomycetes bacterium]|nr:sigma-54-dependent Fis family transcriptional regulator [Planctomycetota bacterium]